MTLEAGRQLIVNADDFGFSRGVSDAILTAHAEGIVSSTSLMVRQPSAGYAVRAARAHPRLDVGLHLDLGEWRFDDGDWKPVYQVVDLNDVESVRTEVARQVATFEELAGRAPTHLDSHQHVHTREPLRSIAMEFSTRLAVPLRHETRGITYCGEFYGQNTEGDSFPEWVGVPALAALLSRLPEGTTELACHPGAGDDRNTMYVAERAIETATLCDPSIRALIESREIRLTSFSAWVREGRQGRGTGRPGPDDPSGTRGRS